MGKGSVRALAIGFAAVVWSAATVAEAEPISQEPLVWRADQFIDSSAGFAGCFRPEGDQDTRRWCLLAYQTEPGGEVRIVTRRDTATPALGVWHTAEPGITDGLYPPSSIDVDTLNRVRVTADIDGFASVDVWLATYPGRHSESTVHCDETQPIVVDTVSSAFAVGYADGGGEGVIDSTDVRPMGSCWPVWIGSTSAAWEMLTGARYQ